MSASPPRGLSPSREPPPKERAPIPKLDADKLLSPEGLPRLRMMTSKLSFKKKGNETADLRKLMSLYQLWGHGLFPKLKFNSFIEKTESVCKQKRLKIFFQAVLAEERRLRYDAAFDALGNPEGGESSAAALQGGGEGERMDDRMDLDEDEEDTPLEHSTSNFNPPPSQSPAPFPSPNATSAPIAAPSSASSSAVPADVLARIEESKARALAKLAERRQRIQDEMEREAALEAAGGAGDEDDMEAAMQADLEAAQSMGI
ncbi:replication fork protection component Swi3-domain-containing protein [Geranomyces variabilis]|nr:replication fork protection component Swi3-domain-containing protein [Geranomyces variabilis]KAJ3143323.1 chromosome segregation in meiosis- protein [Geranomyces variabilis]